MRSEIHSGNDNPADRQVTGMTKALDAAAAYEEIGDNDKLPSLPAVSVLMLVHNHAPYLAQAIEGVLAQDCDFRFELLIGEDASSDDSLAIALHYQHLRPDVVRVVRWCKNAGMNANQRALFALARGGHFAFCEGDDYWCHRGKLAAQHALLFANPEAGCVHSDWVRAVERRGAFDIDMRNTMHRRVRPALLQGDLFHAFHFPKILRTCTVMQTRSAVEAFHASELATRDYLFVDTVRSSYITSRWKVLYWPEIGSVYRERHSSALRSGPRAFLRFLRSSLDFDEHARRFFNGRADYPHAYRWECSLGLLLRSLQAGDFPSLVDATRGLHRRHSAWGFVRAATAAIRLRWPALRVNQRPMPVAVRSESSKAISANQTGNMGHSA